MSRVFVLWFTAYSLYACQVVDGPRIRGADLAAANSVFSAVDPGLDLGPVPLLGIPRVFRIAELVRVAQRAEALLDAPPKDVCFERAGQTLDAETLLPVLRAALANESASIEILDFSRNKIARGKIEFTRASLQHSGMWRGRSVDAGGRSTPIWVRVLASDREVERGDPVRVEVASGGVLLAFDAAAETAGRAGESVVVTNPTTGRRFRARVESKGKVTIRK